MTAGTTRPHRRFADASQRWALSVKLKQASDAIADATDRMIEASNVLLSFAHYVEDAGQGKSGPTGTPQKAFPRASDEAHGTARDFSAGNVVPSPQNTARLLLAPPYLLA